MQLNAILQALLSHDNAARQQAERELKKLARHPEASLQLLEAAQEAHSSQVFLHALSLVFCDITNNALHTS